MFGIPDPWIWIAYVLEVACVVFGIYYGIRYWNQDDSKENNTHSKNPE